MKLISLLYKAVLISVVIISTTNSISYAKGSSDPISASNCGVWKIEGKNISQNGRLGVLQVTPSDENCAGLFTLSNHTGTFLGGGYTLELKDWSINAKTIFRQDKDLVLIPGLDIDITTTPIDKNIKAQVTIYGDIGLKAYVWDLSLFLIKTLFELSPGGACYISEPQMVLLGVRVSSIFMSTGELALKSDFIGAKNELSTIMPLFFQKVSESLVDISVNCSAEAITSNLPLKQAKIVIAFVAWCPNEIFNLLSKGSSSSIILTYIPPTPPISTPSPTPTPTQQTTLIFQGAPHSFKMTGNILCDDSAKCLYYTFTAKVQIKSDRTISGTFNFKNNVGSDPLGYDIPLSGTIDSIVGELMMDGNLLSLKAKIAEGKLFVGTYSIPKFITWSFSLPLK